MNSPAKHHFNPAFSLKPWAVNDGELCEMKRINGNVVAARTPMQLGFKRISIGPTEWAQSMNNISK